MAVINNSPDDENEDNANNIPTPQNDPTVSGTDTDTNFQANTGGNPNTAGTGANTAVPAGSGNSTQTGTARPTGTSQVANPSGFTDIGAYENGNQDAINYLAGQTASDLNNQVNNTNTSTANSTAQANQAVTAGTPQYSSTADQSVIGNPTDTSTSDYDTVVNNLLGTYSGPTTVNPYYAGTTNTAANATQSGQLLTAGTPEGTQQYLENNQGINGQGNSLLDAYLINQNPTAQSTIQPAANQALGAESTENVAINNGNSTLIPNAQATATQTQQQTQADINNAINTQEAAAENQVNQNVANYQAQETAINDFLNNPQTVGANPTAAQQAVLSALGVTADQWNNLVAENTQLQQANYVNQLITQDKEQISQKPDGTYVYTATGQPVQFPANLSPGTQLASTFSPLDASTLYTLQNSVTPEQAADIDALQKLVGQSTPFVNLNDIGSSPTNLFSYNPTAVQSALQTGLQQALAEQQTENAANAPPATTGTGATGSTAITTPSSTNTGALTAATIASSASSVLSTLNLIKNGSKLWNNIQNATGSTPFQLAQEIQQGISDPSITSQLNEAMQQIQDQTQADLNASLSTPMSADQLAALDNNINTTSAAIDNGTYDAEALREASLSQGATQAATTGASSAAADTAATVGTDAAASAGADIAGAGADVALADVGDAAIPAISDSTTQAIDDAAANAGTGAVGEALPFIGAAYSLYNTVNNYQSGATGADALSGAETGASIGAAVGSIIPGIGTAIGAVVGGVIGGVVGAIASAFGPGKTDPETTDWNSYLTAVQQQPDLATQVQNPFLLLAGMFDEKSSTVPIYSNFGRMGEDKFTVAMTQQINNAYNSGKLNASSTPTQVYEQVVSPWMESMGNWNNVGSQYQQAISGLVQQMIAQYMGGTYYNWNSVGGGYAFTGGSQGSITPYAGSTPQELATLQAGLNPPPIRGSGNGKVGPGVDKY